MDTGGVLETYGDTHGYVDGDADTAEFDKPFGLAAVENKIYVADTFNARVRLLNRRTEFLDAGTVTTIAGSDDRDPFYDGPAFSATFPFLRAIAVSNHTRCLSLYVLDNFSGADDYVLRTIEWDGLLCERKHIVLPEDRVFSS